MTLQPPDGLAARPGVIGIGLDLCEVERFDLALRRTPRLVSRVFTPTELAVAQGRVDRLAARWAAKEAALKALALGLFDCRLAEIEVTGGGDEPPSVKVMGRASEICRSRGVTSWMVSLSHDGPVAGAVVVALGVPRSSPLRKTAQA
jgi:holo-[acyl-carrier protein] synthase